MVALAACLFLPAAVVAQETDTTAITRLGAQIEAITRELERIRLGGAVVAQADSSMLGFGPAASKVYRVGRGVSIGGYGEILYENFAADREDGTASGRTDQLDAFRGIVYVGYKFDDRFLFNSEIEFEHGTTGQAGTAALEFAYLDFRLTPMLGFRAGLLLLPMGFLNELHESPAFLGTERPETERWIIPSTWRESGIGVFGEGGGFSYRAYLVNGFDAIGGGSSKAKGFDASGLRGGRQKGSKAVAENFAGVGRVDYTGILGFTLGASAYIGNSGQGNPVPTNPSETISAGTFLWEGHLEYRRHGLDIRGLFAMADLDGVELINLSRGLTGDESVGERLVGWYAQVGYDVLRAARTQHQVIPFVRYEELNTQDRVPAGFAADPATDRSILTFGASWKPLSQIAVKGDVQIHRNGADTGVNQWNLALGYLF